MAKLGGLVRIRTGNLDASAAVKDGAYPFFTCAAEPLRTDSYSFDCECVVLSGNGSVNTSYYCGKFDAYQRTYVLESLDSSILSAAYLWCFLDYYTPVLSSNAKGGVIRYLRLPDITEAEIPLPDINVQRRIADTFMELENALRYRRRQLELIPPLRNARFNELFSGIKADACLGDVCRIVRGSSPRPIKKYLGGDIPWIRIGDADNVNIFLSRTERTITQEGIRHSHTVPEGALIFAACGVSLGFAKITGMSGCIHDGWLAFEDIDSRLDKYFLMQSLCVRQDYFRSVAPAGTQPNLNTQIMKMQPQIIPPPDMQREYTDFLLGTQSLAEDNLRSLSELEAMKKSLQNEVFVRT